MNKLLVILLLLCLANPLLAGGPQQAGNTGKTVSTKQLPVQKLPNPGDMYGMLDMKDPYQTVISGLFAQAVSVDKNSYDFHVYIGARNHQTEPLIVLIPDSRQDVSELLVKGGWKELADAGGLIVAIAKPAGKTWDVSTDMPYLKALYNDTHNRGYYNVQKANNYLVAYGDGVTIAQMWAMAEPGNFAALSTFGDLGAIAPKYMAQTASAKTALSAVSVGDFPMPVWLFVSRMDANNKAVLDCWNKRNNVQDEKFTSDAATAVYFAKTGGIDSLINEQKFLAQTRYTVAKAPAALDAGRTKTVWKFMSSLVRPVGFANNELRSSRALEQWQATQKTMTVKGVTRHWLEFVPRQVFETAPGKAPLVVYFHGGGNMAESMLARSELIKVANDRGFYAIMVTGALSREKNASPTPLFNLLDNPNLFDDYTFVRAAIEDVLKRLPVDTTRVSAMGQSAGGAATLAVSLRMNDIFAAAAVTGAVLQEQLMGLYTSDKVLKGNLMPISILIGAAEQVGGQQIGAQEPGVRRNFPYWAERNGLVSDYDKAKTGFYKSGRYNINDFANAKGVPLVEYVTVDERVHTIVPMDLYFQYDTFVSKWSRGADGTLYYLGKPVEKK